MKNIDTNSMKCGSSTYGIVVTDLPTPVLVAMRDSINNTINQRPNCEVNRQTAHKELSKDDYIQQIRDAIGAAEDAGYEICINDAEWVNRYCDIDLYDPDEDEDEDEDDWDDDWDDEDEDEDEEYDPCDDCSRSTCRGCRLF